MKPDYLSSQLLNPARHGFFGRTDGHSSGIYAGLNCGQGSADDPGIVEKNRRLVARKMGVNHRNLLSLQQIHSTDVVCVTDPVWPHVRPRADAMVTARNDIALGIVTADCAPILFSDPQAKIIGAAHAGWMGALNGIVAATIDAMLDIGAARANISAVIGPCISQKAYEVGQDFLEFFLDSDQNNARFFIGGKSDKYHFDLPMFVLSQLRAQDILAAECVNTCTYDNESKYFSYRRATHRNEPDYGRQISVITNLEL